MQSGSCNEKQALELPRELFEEQAKRRVVVGLLLGEVIRTNELEEAVMSDRDTGAAALAAIVPVALAIGVDPAYIVASAPACYGYYILPTYPSDLAAIQFDRSGTTHIGRFVINHSFILPGLIGVSVSCVFGWIFAAMYGFL